MGKFTEKELKSIAEKYIKSVHSGKDNVNLSKIIKEALQKESKLTISEVDINLVYSELISKNTINDKIISEAVKKIVGQNSLNYIKLVAQQIGKILTAEDLDAIIKLSKLNLQKATVGEIRNAVTQYFNNKKIEQEKAKTDAPKTITNIHSDVEVPLKTVNPGKYALPEDPKNQTFLEKIRTKLQRYGIKALTRGSRNWLEDHVANVSRSPSRTKLITEGKSVSEAYIGKMFMYFYDAKTKQELPYWDKFPLIFVIELYNDGWLGINLHYIDRNLRVKLFDKLLKYADNKSLDKIQKLRLSYNLLKNFSKFPEVKPCIKRYLTSNLKSNLIDIPAVDWENVLFLNVEQFQKQPKEKVWKDSKKAVTNFKKGKK